MKFEFDSNNATELRAVEAAVAVLLGKQTADDHLEAAARHVTEANRLTAPVTVQHVDETHLSLPVDTSLPALVKAGSPTAEKLDAAFLAGYQERQPAGLIPTHEPELIAGPDDELDSAGQPWNPDLHSSSRAKVADGTWKKKRGAGKTEAPQPLVDAGEFPKIPDAPTPSVPLVPAPVTPPVPPAPAVPTPPAPHADGLVTMNDIWALVTNGRTTINVVLAAAQRMGFADLGKVAQTATAEQRAALLKELTA